MLRSFSFFWYSLGILPFGVCGDEIHQLNGRNTDHIIVLSQLGAAKKDRKQVGIPRDWIKHERKCQIQLTRFNLKPENPKHMKL